MPPKRETPQKLREFSRGVSSLGVNQRDSVVIDELAQDGLGYLQVVALARCIAKDKQLLYRAGIHDVVHVDDVPPPEPLQEVEPEPRRSAPAHEAA